MVQSEYVDSGLSSSQLGPGSGRHPAQIASLAEFANLQFAYGQKIGVMDPTIVAYEALGAALAESSPGFENVLGPETTFNARDGITIGPYNPAHPLNDDVGFIVDAYRAVFGITPVTGVINFFSAQLDPLKGAYAAANLYGDAIHQDLVARGAVFGQMLGMKAELDVNFVGLPLAFIRAGRRRTYSRSTLRAFRVPDRGSGNPTPLGGWDRGASKLEWLDGSVQAGQPQCLGLQVPSGVGDEVSLPSPGGRRRDPVPRIAA